MPESGAPADPRTLLAEERTFLAWIRTGIALMGFGFVVARFGLFLRELASLRAIGPLRSSALTVPLGTALLVAGVLVNIFALVHHVRTVRALSIGADRRETFHYGDRGCHRPGRGRTRDGCLSYSGVNREMNSGEGIISKPSKYSVQESLHRLETILREKGIKIFALVDHSGEAEKAGLKMPPTQLLIFGNPRGGTPAMIAAPLLAIDLPLKALAWQDANGQVWISYNDPAYLQHRFGLNDDVMKPLAGIGALIEQAVA
jgi:uncharacterized protein (DUF302 family)/uncharacterized membrane protein YidH (DUF202 family)